MCLGKDVDNISRETVTRVCCCGLPPSDKAATIHTHGELLMSRMRGLNKPVVPKPVLQQSVAAKLHHSGCG